MKVQSQQTMKLYQIIALFNMQSFWATCTYHFTRCQNRSNEARLVFCCPNMWGHTKITHLSMTSQNLGVKKSVITMEWTFFVALVDMMTSVLCITELELFGKRSFASSLSSPRHHHQSQAYVYVWEKWEPSVNIYANCKVYTAKCQVQHFSFFALQIIGLRDSPLRGKLGLDISDQ